jgi:hypothetical protein
VGTSKDKNLKHYALEGVSCLSAAIGGGRRGFERSKLELGEKGLIAISVKLFKTMFKQRVIPIEVEDEEEEDEEEEGIGAKSTAS